MRTTAFSLIELMVVIAIVAVLAAVAVPSYKTYAVKAKVTDKVNMSLALLNKVIVERQSKGAFPASVQVGSTSVASNALWSAIVGDPGGMVGLRYFLPGGVSGNVAYFQLSFNGMDGIPGYAPVSGNPGGTGAATINTTARDDGNEVQIVCGLDPAPGQDVPLAYLPAGCQCTNVSNFRDTGNLFTGC